MPFLRVVRDKRGYDTTYLIHTVRVGSHDEPRVLYVFRSPGDVRVGRDPFDAGVRRELESGNPGVKFDWDALLSGQHLIVSTPDQRRSRRRQSGSQPGSGPGPSARPGEGPPRQRSQARHAGHAAQVPRLIVPSVIEGDTPQARMSFAAHWHGILCEQLPLRVADPERRQALMTLAQRLNPAGWIDADEIATGLQEASEALEQLSGLLMTKRRRKARRGGQRDGQAVRDAPPTDGSAGPEPVGDASSGVWDRAPEGGADLPERPLPGESAGGEPDPT